MVVIVNLLRGSALLVTILWRQFEHIAHAES
jgi:hypothetical protein